jgi:hypothetical protein
MSLVKAGPGQGEKVLLTERRHGRREMGVLSFFGHAYMVLPDNSERQSCGCANARARHSTQGMNNHANYSRKSPTAPTYVAELIPMAIGLAVLNYGKDNYLRFQRIMNDLGYAAGPDCPPPGPPGEFLARRDRRVVEEFLRRYEEYYQFDTSTVGQCCMRILDYDMHDIVSVSLKDGDDTAESYRSQFLARLYLAVKYAACTFTRSKVDEGLLLEGALNDVSHGLRESNIWKKWPGVHADLGHHELYSADMTRIIDRVKLLTKVELVVDKSGLVDVVPRLSSNPCLSAQCGALLWYSLMGRRLISDKNGTDRAKSEYDMRNSIVKWFQKLAMAHGFPIEKVPRFARRNRGRRKEGDADPVRLIDDHDLFIIKIKDEAGAICQWRSNS